MRLLLDTHIFLWYVTANPRLPAPMRDAIRDPNNEVFLSVISLWEISIKHQLGKIALPEPPGIYFPTERAKHAIASLPVDEQAVARIDNLPRIHRDPFDRMLICQALEHGLTIATVDSEISAYPVPVLGKNN